MDVIPFEKPSNRLHKRLGALGVLRRLDRIKDMRIENSPVLPDPILASAPAKAKKVRSPRDIPRPFKALAQARLSFLIMEPMLGFRYEELSLRGDPDTGGLLSHQGSPSEELRLRSRFARSSPTSGGSRRQSVTRPSFPTAQGHAFIHRSAPAIPRP
ncbi:hypothetical protein GCM10007148_07260 [Parvularcula lutaonensis]|nr:hypothetical protein GCM10007148_07260 [Parvularcula lutaonensis]